MILGKVGIKIDWTFLLLYSDKLIVHLHIMHS